MHLILIFLMSSMLGHATFTHLPLPKPLFFSSSTEDGPDNTAIIQITSPARTLDLLWLTLLLSPAINFNQILCTLLYSCLKPSKVLLLLGKPLPVILTLLPSLSLSPCFPWLQGATLAPLSHLPLIPWPANSLEAHEKPLQPELVLFKVWPSLHRPIMFN